MGYLQMIYFSRSSKVSMEKMKNNLLSIAVCTTAYAFRHISQSDKIHNQPLTIVRKKTHCTG